ncbi:MAG: ROK family glucokinase [Ruminococcaceae bacterium]|nr:ROK family glucokinase [Oscillospiraceae bacterium]
MKYYLGVDLGGTNIKAGITDETGNILLKTSVRTDSAGDAQKIADQMVGLCRELVEKAKVSMDDVEAVGVGIPGTVNAENGTVIYCNNLDMDGAPIGAMMQEQLQKPVYLANDASCAALGEFVCGSGKEHNSIILVTLGTGVGGGIILDGKLWEGLEGAGAEIGHMVVHIGGAECTCGRKGCFEAYSSATALVNQTKAAMEKHPESILHAVVAKTGRVSAKTAFDAMRKGDQVAKEVVDNYLHYLSEGVANLINIFAPEAIILGGGVCNEGDALLVPLKEQVIAKCYGGDLIHHADISIASLGNDAGLIGAAMLFHA